MAQFRWGALSGGAGSPTGQRVGTRCGCCGVAGPRPSASGRVSGTGEFCRSRKAFAGCGNSGHRALSAAREGGPLCHANFRSADRGRPCRRAGPSPACRAAAGGVRLRNRLHDAIAELTDDAPLHPAVSMAGPLDAVPAQLAEQVEAVVREAVSNAVRHAGASALSVSVAVRDEVVRISVTYDGTGLPEDVSPSGLGNLRERAESSAAASRSRPGSCRPRSSPIPRASVAPATASGSSTRAATSTWPSWSRRPGATRRSSGTTTASTRCGACRAGNPADRGPLRARAACCPENRAVRLISSTTIRKPAEAAVRSSGSRKGLPGRITHTTTALAESASTKPNSRAGSAHSRNTQLRSRRHSTRADTAHFGVPGFAFEAQTTVGAPRSRRAGPEETGGPNRTEHRQGPRFSADSVPAAAKNSPHSPSGSPAGPPRPVRRANPDP